MTSSVLRRANLAFQPLAIALSVSAAFSPLSFAQTPTDQSLAPVLVTASRTAQKASDVLADSTVITAEEIAESGQTSIIDLLQTQRSIEIKRNGGAGSDADVYIRGANAKQTILLIDGVRSVSSTLGSPAWSAIPLSQIERIEIVRGPLSSFYGADALGGVIQVFTKKGSGAPRLTFSAGAGTYGERVVTAGVSGSTEGEHVIRYSINASQEEADGFSSRVGAGFDPDKDAYTKNNLSGQFSWNLTKGQELGFMFLNSRNNAAYDGNGIPPFKPYIVSEVDVYSVYSRNQITNNWSSLLQLSRSYSKQQQYTSAVPAINNSTQDQISWQNDLKIGSDVLQLLVERREESVVNPTQAKQNNRSRSNNSLALAYQLNRDEHLGSASVRYDNSSAYGSNVTGSLGYGYRLSKALRVSGSVGTSFRAPTYNDLYFAPNFGNPDVKPEKGKNTEIGAYYDDGKSDFSIAYYHNQITDLIVSRTPCPNIILGTSCSYNLNSAVLKGVSVGGSTKVSDFRIYGTLDWQDPRDKATNTLIERRARLHGTLGFSHKYGSFKSGADVIFSGSRFDAAKQVNRLGGYALLNLHASYDLNDDWQLFGRWNNVLDKKYEVARTYQTPGSNVFAGIRYGFK
ncbi:TonB-dependent receptor domain-containing protein [Herminiimonas arsenitoxidans]|uniref:TonB-dependent receptor domain-containing protein n=1 Tax=Herminiimonas arsenitoxidans TaxID=1809410 RepID=UPI0009708D29|nr:TonB-dependent receptor [Herminiimonas arsenitoxidans]